VIEPFTEEIAAIKLRGFLKEMQKDFTPNAVQRILQKVAPDLALPYYLALTRALHQEMLRRWPDRMNR